MFFLSFEQILVEVEDDASDGIVQAEEEEEENSEVDIFPTTSTANRKKFPKSGIKQNASQKRLLFGMHRGVQQTIKEKCKFSKQIL